MIVYAHQLLAAADAMDAKDAEIRSLANGVPVRAAQLRKAGEILRDGPQPECNGITSEMPGFIEVEDQTDAYGMIIFKVGILPSHTYSISVTGEAVECF